MIIITPKCPFNFLEHHEEALWGNVCFQLHHPIEKPAVSWISPVTNRFRFIQQRDADKSRMWEEAEQRYSTIAIVHPVSDVRSESDEDSLHSSPLKVRSET